MGWKLFNCLNKTKTYNLPIVSIPPLYFMVALLEHDFWQKYLISQIIGHIILGVPAGCKKLRDNTSAHLLSGPQQRNRESSNFTCGYIIYDFERWHAAFVDITATFFIWKLDFRSCRLHHQGTKTNWLWKTYIAIAWCVRKKPHLQDFSQKRH